MLTMTIHILILNWNGFLDTCVCLDSVLSSCESISVHLLDNGSDNQEFEKLRRKYGDIKQMQIYYSEVNLGFAAGNNLLLDKLQMEKLQKEDVVLFLNNDTKVDENFFEKLTLAAEQGQDMLTVRTLKMADSARVDNLGMTVTMTGLGKNRMTVAEPLFGPCGGCAGYSVGLLRTLKAEFGYYFDERYFCYGEDVCLAWRARLLGFEPTYLEDAICLHKGGASTGGGFNEFVMYHTFRNRMFNVRKYVANAFILKNWWRYLLFHLGLIFRYGFSVKLVVLLKVYRDYFRQCGEYDFVAGDYDCCDIEDFFQKQIW